MSIVRQGTLPVGSLDHAITLNVQSSGGSHFETVTTTTPYLHRASPQDVASSMKLKKVVGGTIAWNQIINTNYKLAQEHNGVRFIRNSDGSITVSGTVTGYATAYCKISDNTDIKTGHKYYYSSDSKSGLVHIWYNGSGGFLGTSVGIGQITSLANGFYIRIDREETEVNETVNPIAIDLTQMFGSTIADYIYSLEQAHAGDGVAWFKALFGEDYYPYNAGELMSVKTSAHKTVGFNQWDEEWELGNIDTTTGEPYNANNVIRSKNFCGAIGGATYCFNTNGKTFVAHWYDADKNYIKYDLRSDPTESSRLLTAPSNARYFKIRMGVAYGTTYNHDICINLSSTRNGEYEPYKEYTYPLDSDLELRGIPKLDSNNELYYDGDTYASDGTVTRKYGIRAYTAGDATDGSTMITDGTNTVYALSTPTTESADAYTQSQRVGATEEFVDGRTVEIPVGNVSEYKRLIQED